MLSTPLYVRSPPKITLLDPTSCIEYVTMNMEFPVPYNVGMAKLKLKVQWVPYDKTFTEPYNGEIRRVEWHGWNTNDGVHKLRLKHRRILGLDRHCNKDASHSKLYPPQTNVRSVSQCSAVSWALRHNKQHMFRCFQSSAAPPDRTSSPTTTATTESMALTPLRRLCQCVWEKYERIVNRYCTVSGEIQCTSHR